MIRKKAWATALAITTMAFGATACEPLSQKPTVPGVPSGVSASVGDKQANVSYTVPSNGGSAITKYVLVSNRGAVTSVATTSGHRQVTGLTNGVSYTFQIQACNAVGCSAWSTSSNAVTPTGPPASAALTASAVGKQIQWSWVAPTENGRPLAGYRVWLDGSVVDESYSGTTFSRQFGNSEEHTLKVAAVDSTGVQGPTSTATARTVDAAGAPTLTISQLPDEVIVGIPAVACVPKACYAIKSLGSNLGGGKHSVVYHAVQGGQDRVIFVGDLNTSTTNGLPSASVWNGSGHYHQLPAGTEIYAVLDGYLYSNRIVWTTP